LGVGSGFDTPAAEVVQVDNTQTITAATPVSWSATISAGDDATAGVIMNVTGPVTGFIVPGLVIATGPAAGRTIVSQTFGTFGQAGLYTISGGGLLVEPAPVAMTGTTINVTLVSYQNPNQTQTSARGDTTVTTPVVPNPSPVGPTVLATPINASSALTSTGPPANALYPNSLITGLRDYGAAASSSPATTAPLFQNDPARFIGLVNYIRNAYSQNHHYNGSNRMRNDGQWVNNAYTDFNLGGVVDQYGNVFGTATV
jgi:hypothetical protein